MLKIVDPCIHSQVKIVKDGVLQSEEIKRKRIIDTHYAALAANAVTTARESELENPAMFPAIQRKNRDTMPFLFVYLRECVFVPVGCGVHHS